MRIQDWIFFFFYCNAGQEKVVPHEFHKNFVLWKKKKKKNLKSRTVLFFYSTGVWKERGELNSLNAKFLQSRAILTYKLGIASILWARMQIFEWCTHNTHQYDAFYNRMHLQLLKNFLNICLPRSYYQLFVTANNLNLNLITILVQI